jgi:hypothetical protein
MRHILIALHAYHDVHGHFPPAALRGKDGTPLLSWRVAILPYMEQESLYRRFKLDEPWDSPNNLPLLTEMPELFAPPPGDEYQTAAHHTFFQAFVGRGAGFEPDRPLHMHQDFPDGLGETILVVEAGSSVPWSKPADVAFDAAGSFPKLGGVFTGEAPFRIFGSRQLKGMTVGKGDAVVRFVSHPYHEDDLRKAILRGDGQKAGWD